MSNTIPSVSPEMSYGMALLEVQQTSRRDHELLGDALHETQKAEMVVGTIYDGLVNAEKKTQRNLAYFNAAMSVVSVAGAAGGVGAAASPSATSTTTAPAAPPLEVETKVETKVETSTDLKTELQKRGESEKAGLKDYVESALSFELARRGEVSKQDEALFQLASESQDATAESIRETKDLLRAQDQADRDLTVQILKLGVLRFTG